MPNGERRVRRWNGGCCCCCSGRSGRAEGLGSGRCEREREDRAMTRLGVVLVAALAMGAAPVGAAAGTWGEVYLTDEVILAGLGKTQWTFQAMRPNRFERRHAFASAPTVLGGGGGIWLARELAVHFHCQSVGVQGEKTLTFMRAFWFTRRGAELMTVEPHRPFFPHEDVSVSGGIDEISVFWKARFGDEGEWQRFLWELDTTRGDLGVVEGSVTRPVVRWRVLTLENLPIFNIHFVTTKRDFVTTQRDGRTWPGEGFFRSLTSEDFWTFRIDPPEYFDGAPVREWRIPLRGSGRAIGQALAHCKGE